MLRSLYSGISGLKNHQARMDVVGNNISNVNTTGYKSGRVNFQDSLSQYYSNNPAIGQNQIGTGMKVASINNNFTQGPMQNTGRTLDLAIQGDAFFGVANESGAGDPDYYTRDGVFFLSPNGANGYYIVNSDGKYLTGVDGGPITITASSGSVDITTLSISETGEIAGKDSEGNALTVSQPIALYSFKNPEGLKKMGGNLYQATDTSGDSNPVDLTDADYKGTNSIASGYLEMSNVDLSQEMVDMMVTQRGFQANARTITVSDTLLEELVNLKR
ncbi:flagellar hook-basal body protein [Desulforamulus ruminis]|uniref:Flagellar hook protein FlgE n=1 Tax=Desulforamulus ruminis (strain ATCC 23193 / DSM 2154 / NCIMB 8452 / DL) TaxID=696281 RepID=F6DNS5_DESRL|nr:flagellar hook-basal body complex protein [Desulforamulus ruminis]AEG59520.1 flagellar hook-basal body protein [Desulforamulus ruminis DSM 2154]